MIDIKHHLNQFLNNPEFVQFVSDSKAVFKISFKLLSLFVFLSVALPSIITFLFWIDFSNSGAEKTTSFLESVAIFLIFSGYFIYSITAFVSVFRIRKWCVAILVSYNSFIAFTYLLQYLVSLGSLGPDFSFNLIVYGITLSNILLTVVNYKVFEMSINSKISAHGG
ncbi:hypothetical protein EHQ81_19485 [Leptospira selangorensis]|uniref:Uncharacterized protein n=1 Tax=Leptospira selangorensis TaxID=2484982 RepID=A0A5F2C6E0_9LEPT|nr:hypothetical protein [Leptospira selangorensis]TGM10289.1 hypothetical protein EHQ81_19485 [Leptospira selangorensis]TGM27951.1 hypothetical protein EHQ82_01665 [Leptospira selangorensis]